MLQPHPLSVAAPRRSAAIYVVGALVMLWALSGAAQVTNSSPYLSSPALPNAGPSLLRVMGALAVVLGLFLGGVWLFRNGRQLAFRRGGAPRLNVLESRSLGGRQAVFVIGYDQERFLVASTPAGINLLSHLPAAAPEEAQPQAAPGAGMPFAQALAQVLRGQTGMKKGGGK